MSNHIRFNGTADSDDWLVMSNQGTDCFLDLLILTADVLDKTEHQRELIDFLKAQKMVNAMAPGMADFDILDLPWRGECFADDVQFVLRVTESAKTEEAIAGSMVKIIGKHGEAAEPYILEILKGKDEVWKHNVLSYLLYEWPSYPGDALMHEIIRIADHPTAEESKDEVDQAANEFLEAYA